MTTRRYQDDEVREIFSLATTGGASDRTLPAESGGLTLDELQRIGREVGIEPARVAYAAARLDARGLPSPVRRVFGVPVAMTRLIDLPRAPTDREWEQMVAQFRTLYGAQGVATSSGGLREWTHGEVQISVEPTERGEQLRLSATNELADVLNAFSLLFGGMSLLMAAVVAAAGKPQKALVFLALFGGMSLAAFGANIIRMPRWAREREEQMDLAAVHVVKLLSSP
jgi:hypothetical protein